MCQKYIFLPKLYLPVLLALAAPLAPLPVVAKHDFPLSDFSAETGHAATLVWALPMVPVPLPPVVADELAQIVEVVLAGVVGVGRPALGQAVQLQLVLAAVREQLLGLVERVLVLAGQPENLCKNFSTFKKIVFCLKLRKTPKFILLKKKIDPKEGTTPTKGAHINQTSNKQQQMPLSFFPHLIGPFLTTIFQWKGC